MCWRGQKWTHWNWTKEHFRPVTWNFQEHLDVGPWLHRPSEAPNHGAGQESHGCQAGCHQGPGSIWRNRSILNNWVYMFIKECMLSWLTQRYPVGITENELRGMSSISKVPCCCCDDPCWSFWQKKSSTTMFTSSSPWMGFRLQWPVSLAQFHAWSHMDLRMSTSDACSMKSNILGIAMALFLNPNLNPIRCLLGPVFFVSKKNTAAPHATLASVQCGAVPFGQLDFHLLKVPVFQEQFPQFGTSERLVTDPTQYGFGGWYSMSSLWVDASCRFQRYMVNMNDRFS